VKSVKSVKKQLDPQRIIHHTSGHKYRHRGRAREGWARKLLILLYAIVISAGRRCGSGCKITDFTDFTDLGRSAGLVFVREWRLLRVTLGRK
jgi:hypothetical protein